MSYVLEGVKGFSENQFYSGLKSKYKIFNVFVNNNLQYIKKETLVNIWESIPFLTLQDCLEETNQSLKSVLFSCYGAENIIKMKDVEIIDTKTISRINKKIENNKVIKYNLEETYALYSIPGELLGKTYNSWDKIRSVKILMCNCPTTLEQYFLFVKDDIIDALQAVVSTFRTFYKDKDIIKIYRQGDVIALNVVKDSVESNWSSNEISLDTYNNKIVWQS